MKRGVKITLIVLAVLLTIGIIVFVSADVMISRFATKEVNKALASLPAGEASCGNIIVRVFSGTASVNDIQWTYRGEPIIQKRDTLYPGSRIAIDRIDIGRIFYSMLFKKQVLIHDIRIVRPEVELWMDEEHPELCFPQIPKDSTADSAAFPLRRAELMHLHIKHASMALHSLSTKLDVAADSLSLSVHHLAYDSVFSYCDSVYRLQLAHAKVITPDGRMLIETRNLEHSDQGPLTLGATHIGNTMPKLGLGNIVREPVTWIDLFVDRVETSPFNPVRKALAQDLTLDKIEAEVRLMDVFRDERYKPRSICDMPQTIMRAIPVVFDIRHVEASVKKINIAFASTNKNIGKLSFSGIKASVANVTNRKGATLRAKGNCRVGAGEASGGFVMTMDKHCSWGLDMHARQINTSILDHFIRPLVGMTSECMIDKLSVHYTGDDVKADGVFEMLYHGFQVKVHKEDDIPYKIITKNANTFNTLGNSLLPKSNPSSVDTRPRAYKITWKRDEWKPVPLYLFGPCIDGIKKTMLPGLYVHLQTKEVD